MTPNDDVPGALDGARSGAPGPGVMEAFRTFRLPTLLFVMFIVLLGAVGVEIYQAERAAIRRSQTPTTLKPGMRA